MTPEEFKAARPRGRKPRPLSEWKCLDCGKIYSPEDFYHQGKERKRPCSRCKRCTNLKSSSSKKAGRTEYRRTAKGLASDLMTGPKKRGSVVTITSEWIANKIDAGVCEVTGIAFDLSPPNGRRRPFCPSLDQKIPGRGYTIENTQVVCWIYNAAKGNASHEDVMIMARALLNDTGRI